MIITNWDRIVRKTDDLTDAGIYIMYGDRGECLYVGESGNVGSRLIAHLFGSNRTGPSFVGEFVVRQKQQSRTWPVVIIEPEDCSTVHYKKMKVFWKENPPSNTFDVYKFRSQRSHREFVESFLIGDLAPLFNSLLNNGKRSRPLTESESEYYFSHSEPGESSSFYIGI